MTREAASMTGGDVSAETRAGAAVNGDAAVLAGDAASSKECHDELYPGLDVLFQPEAGAPGEPVGTGAAALPASLLV